MPIAFAVLVLQTSVDPPPRTAALATTAVAKRTATAIVIDGKDNEEVWHTAQAITGFRQFQPVEDGEPSVRTEARVAYDDHNFYVFVRAFDPHPDSIKTLLARRDTRVCCDQIKIVIDSYHDRRTGFEFAVNPAGVKRDYAIYGDGDQEDGAWDAVWDVATQVDSLGWTAEFRIPLSQLRYPHLPSNTFGFAVWRDIDRRGGERVGWPLYRTSRRGFSSQLGEVIGLDGLAAPTRLELIPYALTKNEPEGYAHVQSATAGGDIKYGLTSNITIDATVNPDFGQVEADPSVVNLTSFETFYQERRPFFVEGTGIFNFNVNCSIVNCSGEGLFYSRRIGHDPARIVGAAKITGRLPSGLTIGGLEGLTKRAVGDSGDVTLEPLTNYAALRVTQDFRAGQSAIGFMTTAVNRNTDSWTENSFHNHAYVGAVDFRHRFAKGMYEVSGSFDLSTVAGTPAMIAATQQNSTHNFQRPDDNVQYDPTRTSLSGNSEELLFTKQNGFINFQTSYQRRSPGFEINDLGFLYQSDQQSWNNWASMNWRKPVLFLQRAFWNFNWWQYWTSEGLPTERAFNTNLHLGFNNQWTLHMGGTIAGLGGVFCDRCARGGPALRVDRAVYPWFGFLGDPRPWITPVMFVNLSRSDDGRSTNVSASPEVDVRAGSQFRGSVVLNLSHYIGDRQDINPQTDATGTHYLFAHIDQKTVSMTFRVDYTATNTLTLQVYASPFVSRGEWSNLRELSATPRAASYDDRFQPYAGTIPEDFNSKFFNSNVVLRWEYRPGSTLYLVWNQGRQNFDPTAPGDNVGDDFGKLFNSRPLNTFLIKASYWLSR
ncbi:MAG TPA: DUF5916 domain-containing protein [Gemmatimonadales bacterium]|nr:DUF5916 domain-containing protein [Gemmatimonadales bacterium]